jgi:hypothetical protein
MLNVFTSTKDSLTFKNELTSIKIDKVNSFYNDQVILKAEEQKEFPHKIYDKIPEKLSLYFVWRNRKYLQNFVIYNYSIWADTFVERRILKDVKSECIKYKDNTVKYTFFTLLGSLIIMRKNIYFNLLALFIVYQSLHSYFLADIMFYKNLNNILMKFQINEKYRLGKETREFIKFLNDRAWLNEEGKLSRYNKFIENDIFKIHLHEKYFDYLTPAKEFDFHEELTKKLERKRLNQIEKLKLNKKSV